MSVLRLPWRHASLGLGERARRWAIKRQGIDPRHLDLARNRIYILPTRTGLTYAVAVFVLLLGSMNYNNNMGFVLSFLLAAVGLVAMHHCHRNLVELKVDFNGVDPVFAGNEAQFRFVLGNTRSIGRWQIRVAWDKAHATYIDVYPQSKQEFSLAIKTDTRGWLTAPRLAVSTTFPLGLFRAWAWVNMEILALVYPKPAEARPERSKWSGSEYSGGHQQLGEDEFSELREFRHGDSPRRIAWKTVARLGTLLVKEYREGGQMPVWLDWDDIAAPDRETRISILARLVLDAHHDGLHFGLRLPGVALPPERGETHVHRCLRQLATFGLPEKASGNSSATASRQ